MDMGEGDRHRKRDRCGMVRDGKLIFGQDWGVDKIGSVIYILVV